ncbi:PREDICTED: F-box/LRR-repeat protein 21 [Nicrophorus vespilloides]|uniref:F-box/LRR-repeat protein 21 n=1 Tax=Nicrophorus vespilloides TaxID=110193 RepID=A0ABM1MRI8_NICVS|nr:PREDICTED: F-box/LRR-repeat protein 21 [Nicrophorus vespilloides]
MARNEKSEYGKKFKEQHHHFSPTLWNSTYLTRNASNKALIDFEVKPDRRGRRKSRFETRWDELPDPILEQIFKYLTIRERYYASLVCRSWYEGFYLPYVWSEFVLGDSTLTRARFNYYQGWQYVLDHVRTQMCLTQVGPHFRKLTFEPMMNFFNLYEFMNMVSWYCEQNDNRLVNVKGVAAKVRTLRFTFPCNMDSREDFEGVTLFGTGGRLLGALKRLMSNLPKLKRLELIDLMLDYKEAQHLLDGVCEACCLTLDTLVLINATKMSHQILHVGVFLNLQVLVLSPQNLGDDVIELIGYTKLKHLHILQNRYTPDCVETHVEPKVWKSCKKSNPRISIHFEMECIKEKTIIWPMGAPINSIIYDTPTIGVELSHVIQIIENYKDSLQVFGHKGLPRGYRPKSFHSRIDEPVMFLCRKCDNLKVLVISERVSTATLLLIATTCRKLKKLHVRRNGVIKKCDWDYNQTWSDEYYQWLKDSSRSYETVEREISEVLGYKWCMLSDKNFKGLHVDLHEEL